MLQYLTTLPAGPNRPADGHKGTFGSVLIAAGSRGMSGAAALAGLGALRGGAGLVTLAVPASIQAIVAALEPSYLTITLPEDADGRPTQAAWEVLQMACANKTVLACGSGWGQSTDLQHLVAWIYHELALPVVLDADGLNALAQQPFLLQQKPTAPRILTPHPGEFARLLNIKTEEVQQSRETLAVEFAQRTGTILLLKGSPTIITDGAHIALNQTGNNGMGTGGTGDVLTGLIAALVAQKMSPFAAAQLGAHLHGLAGDLAAADLSAPGLISSDLPRYLGPAWQQFLTLR